jgi:hypothetical protein
VHDHHACSFHSYSTEQRCNNKTEISYCGITKEAVANYFQQDRIQLKSSTNLSEKPCPLRPSSALSDLLPFISLDFLRAASFIALIMEAVQTSETLASSYQSRQRYTPVDSRLHAHLVNNTDFKIRKEFLTKLCSLTLLQQTLCTRGTYHKLFTIWRELRRNVRCNSCYIKECADTLNSYGFIIRLQTNHTSVCTQFTEMESLSGCRYKAISNSCRTEWRVSLGLCSVHQARTNASHAVTDSPPLAAPLSAAWRHCLHRLSLSGS